MAGLDNPLAGVNGISRRRLEWRPWRRPVVWLGLALSLPTLLLWPLQAAGSLQQVPAVVHVHSTWSSGDQTLDEIIARARAVGVEAIFLTENHLQRFEYGLPPLRNLLRYRVEYPSVLSRGPDPFLRAVQEVNARQKEVLLIPGAEIIAHYYWTGSLWQGTLTMHNAQKNLLALGLAQTEDYRDLPDVGNPGAERWGVVSLWLLSPVLLVGPGVWLLRTRRRRIVRLQYYQVAVERRFTAYGILCLAMGAALLANNAPFRASSLSPYDPDAGLRPHQAVINFVNSRGGVSAWSLPEARDDQAVRVAGLRAAIRTDPYPEDLLRTDRFTAFGGIYEDTTSFTDPGGGWDRLLVDYLNDRRVTPAWALGEAAYHAEGRAGKRFGDVQTVFLVDRKDPPALMDALRAGHFYALKRSPENGLVLEEFQVLVSERPPAEAGDRILLHADDRPEVRAAIHATGGRQIAIQASLVRNGMLVRSLRGETPFTLRWSESAPAAGTNLFFRLEVRGPAGHRILSNPIFVQSAGG